MKRLLWLLSMSLILTLTVRSGGGSAHASPLAPINISGTVIYDDLQPFVGALVIVTSGSGSVTVTTDANGAFSVSGITPPYDAAVVIENKSIIYKGLTRTDPTLVFRVFDPGVFRRATLSGTVSGGAGFPQPANHKTVITFRSPEGLGIAAVNTNTGAYNIRMVGWYGPAATTGNIRALQWQYNPATGLPTDYKGYGEKLITLTNGGTLTGQNVAMSNVSEAAISGSVTLPAGYNLDYKRMYVGFADRSLIEVLDHENTDPNFTYTTPNITGATLQMEVIAKNAAGTTVTTTKPGLAVNATGVSIPLPAGSDLLLPASGATGVNYSTTFSYTPFSGGVHFVVFDGSGKNPDYVVVTTAASASIPNLSAVGLGLPASTNYSWTVYGAAPFATVDAAAGPEGWLAVYQGTAEGSFSESSGRTFTTAP